MFKKTWDSQPTKTTRSFRSWTIIRARFLLMSRRIALLSRRSTTFLRKTPTSTVKWGTRSKTFAFQPTKWTNSTLSSTNTATKSVPTTNNLRLTNRESKNWSLRTVRSAKKSAQPNKTSVSLLDKWASSKTSLSSCAPKTRNWRDASLKTRINSRKTEEKHRAKSQFWAKNASASMLWSRSATAKSKPLVEKFNNTSKSLDYHLTKLVSLLLKLHNIRVNLLLLHNSLRLIN